MMYVFSDFARLGALVYAASFIDSALGSNGTLLNGTAGLAAKWAAWSAYWVAAGLVGTGVWILGHECKSHRDL
jgi:omega-6 fatty acid desaturase (delta-12 desaturase)